MGVFGFSEDDAKRIGKAVRVVERLGITDQSGPSTPEVSRGVRLLMAKHSGTAGWATGSTAVVTVYNGQVGSVASAMTMVAYNHYIKFSTDTSCTSRWVALGHNGFHWLPVDSQSDCGTCISEIGGVDFKVFPGYAKTASQILGHDTSGCIKWFDTTACSTVTA